MKRLLVMIGLIVQALPAIAGNLDVGEDSKRACLFHVEEELRLEKLNEPERFKQLGEDHLRSMLNSFCLFQEREAAAFLKKIAADIPEEFIYSCNRKATARGDEYSRNSYLAMFECFDDLLTKVPRSDMPRGSAIIYSGRNEIRFWNMEECLKARQEGQVCVSR